MFYFEGIWEVSIKKTLTVRVPRYILFQGRLEPVQIGNESMNREGLGSQAIDSDNINRDQAEEIVRKFAASNRVDDLVFSSELNFDERKEIRMMAKRYGLSEKMAVQPAGRVGRPCYL